MGIYRVHGLTRSYFTRKVTGYLDYTDRAWRLEPGGVNDNEEATAAGWNGGMPVIFRPDGTPMWDSTSVIAHLDTHPEIDPRRRAIPDDPTLRFLAYFLDDFSDEWFYRPAVGSRWSYPANTVTAGWQIAQELATGRGVPAAVMREMVVATMTGSLPKLGVTEHNVDAWMNQVFVRWLEALEPHLSATGYLLGSRPSVADFAMFGANVAHFVGDPYCRELADEHGPATVAHTDRLVAPQYQTFGDWLDPDDLPDTLIAVLAEAGRHYLPWVAEATVEGAATVELTPGVTAEIATTPFLDQARGIMLARYVADRSPVLDDILDRAGVLAYYADHADRATAVPDDTAIAQPSDNRPYAVN
ncbi:MAG: glutathione S-transferase C-terminal domain-containing protein [Actinomycetota bacterium]